MPGLQLGHTVGHPWLWWHHAHKMARHGVLQSTWKGFYTTCLCIPWLPLCDHQGALGGITKQVPSHETGHKWEHFIIWNGGVCVTHEKKQECGCVFLQCQDVCVAIRAYFKRGSNEISANMRNVSPLKHTWFAISMYSVITLWEN